MRYDSFDLLFEFQILKDRPEEIVKSLFWFRAKVGISIRSNPCYFFVRIPEESLQEMFL